MRREATRIGAPLAGTALALLLLVVPLLIAVAAIAPGGLPHEAQACAATSHSASLAALDRIDRWLRQGPDLLLAPPSPETVLRASAPPRGRPVRPTPAARPVERASLERRF